MKTILVVGGAGFVGNALVKELSKNSEYVVYCLDDYSSSENHFSKYFLRNTNKNEIFYNNVYYIEGHSSSIFEKCGHIKPDVVFHFGEFSRIDRSWVEIDKLMKSNLYGTSRVLEYCRLNNSFLVYSASSAVLGNNKEDSNLTPYAWTKCKMVELIKLYHKWFNLQYLITYFYNVYGEGQISKGPYATVIGIFEEQYKAKIPLTVVKPGTQSRCFTHISDIVSGLMRSFTSVKNREVQICSNDELTVEELARLFTDDIVYLEERKGDRKSSTKLDKDILRDELGWDTVKDLKEYISKVKSEIDTK